ncbi:hypothetical protein CDL62_15745 [Alkalitalea saponilacus]|nr:hypothetical protein CDL62_15410 [Alkalitalea saponilacus]ASB50472.1 hypothetical protein CDL62_15600 [Alkalitalea saponilacus]ASB50498.1 hypothetical protein CDL62_15745 [Alkalitalea saponilacus]
MNPFFLIFVTVILIQLNLKNGFFLPISFIKNLSNTGDLKTGFQPKHFILPFKNFLPKPRCQKIENFPDSEWIVFG